MTTNFQPDFKHEFFLPSQQRRSVFLRSVNAARNSKSSNVRNRLGRVCSPHAVREHACPALYYTISPTNTATNPISVDQPYAGPAASCCSINGTHSICLYLVEYSTVYATLSTTKFIPEITPEGFQPYVAKPASYMTS
jgi:hypothetical protein